MRESVRWHCDVMVLLVVLAAIDGVDSCVAINGFPRFGIERGVQAVAACCRVIV